MVTFRSVDLTAFHWKKTSKCIYFQTDIVAPSRVQWTNQREKLLERGNIKKKSIFISRSL